MAATKLAGRVRLVLNTVNIYSYQGRQMDERSALIDRDRSDIIDRLEGLLRWLVITTVDDDELAHPGVSESLRHAHQLSVDLKTTRRDQSAGPNHHAD